MRTEDQFFQDEWSSGLSRTELRQALRKRRQALGAEEQAEAAKGLLQQLLKRADYRNSQSIALYLAHDGEISPEHVARDAWEQGKQCFLPVLDPNDKSRMLFQAYHSDTVLVANRFNISEPELNLAECIDPEKLDLVLMPLTGFDARGGRLGMGGGFYDRTFSFVGENCTLMLLGLAHECQRVAKMPVAEWDVPVQGVITGKRCY